MNRLDGHFDAVLHLMDRQVVDSDGLMVCKVDDLELTQLDDGAITITGILAGPEAWLPRFGGHLGDLLRTQWRRLGIEHAHRDQPWRIPLTDVARLGSGVELSRARDGVLRLQPEEGTAPGAARHRMNDFLEATVVGPSGTELGHVLDVRVRPEPGSRGQLPFTGLVVGRGRPGSLLGYDRRGDMGPWVVKRAVRALHRHSGFLSWDAVTRVDWRERRVVAATDDLDELKPATD